MSLSWNNGLGSNFGFLDGHQNLTKCLSYNFKTSHTNTLVEYRLFTSANGLTFLYFSYYCHCVSVNLKYQVVNFK